MTLTEIRAALESRGLRPLKQFGQNFLHDQNLARWLAEHALDGIPAGATAVEIGPGLGALTEYLLERDVHLIALEKDRGLSQFLREKFPNFDEYARHVPRMLPRITRYRSDEAGGGFSLQLYLKHHEWNALLGAMA